MVDLYDELNRLVEDNDSFATIGDAVGDQILSSETDLSYNQSEFMSNQIDFMRYLNEEILAGNFEIQHYASKEQIEAEIKKLTKERGITKEQAKNMYRDYILSWIDSMKLNVSPVRLMDIGEAFLGKLSIKPVTNVKKSDGFFDFGLDLHNVNAFIEKSNKVKILTNRDIQKLGEIVFAKDVLSSINSAVYDVLIDEYSKISNPEMKGLIHTNAIASIVATKLQMIDSNFSLLLEKLEKESAVISTEINDLFDKHSVVIISVKKIEDFINSIKAEILSIMPLVKEVQSSALMLKTITDKKIDAGNIKNVLNYMNDLFMLSIPLEHIYDKLFNSTNLIYKKTGLAFPTVISASDSISKLIIHTIVHLNNLIAIISQFSHNRSSFFMEKIEGIKKGMPYASTTSMSGDSISFLFYVTDYVDSVLSGLGLGSKTVSDIKAIMSKFLFDRPGLDDDVVSFVQTRIADNVISALS